MGARTLGGMTIVGAVALAATTQAACGGSAPDARYPARDDGCAVRSYPGQASIPVDDLGTVRIECAGGGSCERRLMDLVCRRGGDVVWGMADNALTATTLVGHAAHSKRAAKGTGQRGCPVQVYSGQVPFATENIGPVTALCAEDDAREVCLRELQDQVCLLGGDLVWQVDGPTPEGTQNGIKQRMHGRAAHTK
jgi:hypothetical protein